MGNVCGTKQKDDTVYLSLSGKKVNSINRLNNREEIQQQKFQNMKLYMVSCSQLYSGLAREVNKRAKDPATHSNLNFEFVDIRNQELFRKSTLLTSMNIDGKESKKSLQDKQTLKAIFDFKDIFIISDKGFKESSDAVIEIISQFQKLSISYKTVNFVRKSFQEIKEEFPFMVLELDWNKKESYDDQMKNFINGFSYPYMIYDHQDVWQSLQNGKSAIKPNKFKVFLHNNNLVQQNLKINENFYDRFEIKGVIQTQTEKIQLKNIENIEIEFKNDKEIKKNQEKLMSQIRIKLDAGKNIMIIHDFEKKEHFISILKMMQAFMYEKLYIFEDNVREYFRNKFQKNIQDSLESQNVDIQNLNNLNQNNLLPVQSIQIKSSITNNDKTNTLTQLFQNLFKETGKKQDVLDSIKEFIIKVLSNIVQNPNDQKYKTLKKEKQFLQEKIFKFKNAVLIIEELGFKEDANKQSYTNQLDVKYIKLFQGDLGVAYRQFMNNNKK